MRSPSFPLHHRAWLTVVGAALVAATISGSVSERASDLRVGSAAGDSAGAAAGRPVGANLDDARFLASPWPTDVPTSTTTTAPPPPPPTTVPPTTAPAPPSTRGTRAAPPPAPTTDGSSDSSALAAAAAAAAPARPSADDPLGRAQAALEAAVPAGWRSAIPVQLQIISGSTSWARTDGVIEVGRYHATGRWNHLVAVLAHEFGHLIAYRYGSGAYLGAAPDGWPYNGASPAEAWADCVSRAFTGINDPTPGLASCQGDTLAWTANWLASHP